MAIVYSIGNFNNTFSSLTCSIDEQFIHPQQLLIDGTLSDNIILTNTFFLNCVNNSNIDFKLSSYTFWQKNTTYNLRLNSGFFIDSITGDPSNSQIIQITTPSTGPILYFPGSDNDFNDSYIRLDFDRLIYPEAGNIYLYDSSNNLLQTYNSNSRIYKNNTITLNVKGLLQASSTYYLLTDTNWVVDQYNFSADQLTTNTQFTWTTVSEPYFKDLAGQLICSSSLTCTPIEYYPITNWPDTQGYTNALFYNNKHNYLWGINATGYTTITAPYINEPDRGVNYTISFFSSLGGFSSNLNGSDYSSNWNFTGTQTQINNILSNGIIFWPYKGTASSGSYTYTQTRSDLSVTQWSKSYNLNNVGSYNIPSTTTTFNNFGTNSFTISFEQNRYLQMDLLVVGGGGGGGSATAFGTANGAPVSGNGGNYAGGAGGCGGVYEILNTSIPNAGNYNIIVGAGGGGSTYYLDGGGNGTNSSAFNVIANGGYGGHSDSNGPGYGGAQGNVYVNGNLYQTGNAGGTPPATAHTGGLIENFGGFGASSGSGGPGSSGITSSILGFVIASGSSGGGFQQNTIGGGGYDAWNGEHIGGTQVYSGQAGLTGIVVIKLHI